MALADWQRVYALSALRRHFPPFVGCAVGRLAEMTALLSSPGTVPDQHHGIVARLRGATKRFGTVVALDNLDLEIRRGEFLALLGPNGAGKTTAINLLLGLRAPSAGDAELLGLAPTDRRARSRCGVMLQQSGVPTHLSVREILRLFARCRHSSAGSRRSCRHTTSARSPWTAVGIVDQPIAASLARLAGYGLLFIATAAWAYRREEGRTFG